MARVLIVDDAADQVKLLAHGLVNAGFDVLTAYSGPQALQVARDEIPDVILLDVLMPGMDGIEVCRCLKANHRLRSIPVIMISAKEEEGDIIEGLDAGAQDYVTKPFSFPIVAARVRSASRIKTAHDTIEEMNQRLDQARRQAELASQSKSDFLANMSHEIRTPMTAILGFAEMLFEPDLSEADRLAAVHSIHGNGEYLLEIINDILDLSKLEAGRMMIERTPCSPCNLIAGIESLMRVQAGAKGLTFDTEYIGAIPETIHSAPAHLRQILINLLGNAVKFTEVGGVRLITRFVSADRGPMLQFDILDTGIGMTKEQARELFQPFTQVDTSVTRKFGGTGAGLAISKRFAEMLGGSISIVDTKEGVGTRFRVTTTTGPLDGVRMIEDPASATLVKPAKTPEARGSVQSLDCRILLAEDGPDNQRLISYVLRKAGAQVTVVENGKLAADAALAARPAGDRFGMILMDMQMPIMDGYQATRLLRQKGYSGPIIALTAHAMPDDRQKCIDAGCDDYATKPIDRSALIGVIRKRLERGDAAAQQPRGDSGLLFDPLVQPAHAPH